MMERAEACQKAVTQASRTWTGRVDQDMTPWEKRGVFHGHAPQFRWGIAPLHDHPLYGKRRGCAASPS
jgi:hypothetical protein